MTEGGAKLIADSRRLAVRITESALALWLVAGGFAWAADGSRALGALAAFSAGAAVIASLLAGAAWQSWRRLRRDYGAL